MENDRIDLVPDIARVLRPGGVALYENIHVSLLSQLSFSPGLPG